MVMDDYSADVWRMLLLWLFHDCLKGWHSLDRARRSQCDTADCPFTAHYVASNRSAASVTAVYLHNELKMQTGGQLGLILTHWNTHCSHQHSACMMQMKTDRTSSGVLEISPKRFSLDIKETSDFSAIYNHHCGDWFYQVSLFDPLETCFSSV